VNGYSHYLNMVKLDEQFPELWEDVGSLAVARHNRLKSRLLPPMMRIPKGIVAVFVGTADALFEKCIRRTRIERSSRFSLELFEETRCEEQGSGPRS